MYEVQVRKEIGRKKTPFGGDASSVALTLKLQKVHPLNARQKVVSRGPSRRDKYFLLRENVEYRELIEESRDSR